MQPPSLPAKNNAKTLLSIYQNHQKQWSERLFANGAGNYPSFLQPIWTGKGSAKYCNLLDVVAPVYALTYDMSIKPI